MLDTETTGTDHTTGDRIVEIGAIELLNSIPTGRHFHRYINPQRAMSQGAFAVHGLGDDFLADKPVFHAIADELHAFFGDAQLVIHNAAFDMGFLNAEFTRSGHPLLGSERAIDTLLLARRKHPGASNTLDALCSRYGIDNSRRTKHGALLDAELLAEIYLELMGGRQSTLGLAQAEEESVPGALLVQRERRVPPNHSRLSDEERVAHAAFVAQLGSSAVWAEYLGGA